jgi:3-hydroxybutyryl-CoA dehydrogenase
MELHTIAIAGLGLLGRGIAACCLSHGFRVIAFTRHNETHAAAQRYIDHAMNELIARAGLSNSVTSTLKDQYLPVTSLQEFGASDFVIETVIEDENVKRQVFDEIEAVIRADVPVATNTSAIPISNLQRDRKHPGRFVGMHWAEPAHATRFCELIRGELTTDQAFAQVAGLARLLGKEPCLVQKDVPAFIVNRIGYAMYREAVHILEMGVADVDTIDTSCRNAFGLWASMCGPLRWMDITGGPASYAKTIAKILPTLDNRTELADTFQNMIREESGGTSNGRGFYQYTEEDRKHWDSLLLEHSWKVRDILDEHFPLSHQGSSSQSRFPQKDT